MHVFSIAETIGQVSRDQQRQQGKSPPKKEKKRFHYFSGFFLVNKGKRKEMEQRPPKTCVIA